MQETRQNYKIGKTMAEASPAHIEWQRPRHGAAPSGTTSLAGCAAGRAEVPSYQAERGRGALSNVTPRFETETRCQEVDGWDLPEEVARLRTQVTREHAKTIITQNNSPDISFDRSINPYRGCEHGCVYCYARPTHAFVGLSPGLDFETRLFAKANAAELLERELSAPGYRPKTIAIGTDTDPYQPVERKQRVMRALLEVLARTNHPVGIVTKSALILRDLDLLTPMAERGLVKVAISVTTLEPLLARKMEPRAASPLRRLETLRQLAAAKIPAAVMVAPIIPAINDAEIEAILARAKAMGASEAGYVLLRLPLEVRDLFAEWLEAHFPDKLKHVMSLMRSARGGKLYDPRFGLRMTGSGPYAWMLGRRFEAAAKRLELTRSRAPLRCDLFRPPARQGEQLQLF